MGETGQVAGVLLAAGGGSRMGTPKALVEFAGERLADRGVRLLAEGGCRPVVVVEGAAEISTAEIGVEGVMTVHNPDWESGMGSSLQVGLRSLPGTAHGAVIALVDQPLVRPAAVRRLIEAFRCGATVAVATYGSAPRNPVLIARGHFTEVAALAAGDVGARLFLRAHPELVVKVPCDDAGDPADIDTSERRSGRRAPSGNGRPRSRMTGRMARRATSPRRLLEAQADFSISEVGG
ncbi:nucleotidyltransferase family protein [Microbispora sp. H11081]|uniref:nucleotidyltransferase family protein n=1 Tax=Microbispora sp. H11081 TaxID=2729107 RepID=UPI00289C09EB|nr:nucleotidyltransferase family protein [Microbispora sp. H11081]